MVVIRKLEKCVHCKAPLEYDNELGMAHEDGIIRTCHTCYWGHPDRQVDGEDRRNPAPQEQDADQLLGAGIIDRVNRVEVPLLFKEGQPRVIIIAGMEMCNCNLCRRDLYSMPEWVPGSDDR